MAVTAPTAEVRSATPGRSEATARRVPAPRAATLLLGALLAALAYGALAHGEAQIPEENRLQVALAVIAVFACGAWPFDGGLRLNAARWGWVGVGLLVAFVAWTAISLAWSVAPDRTWTEFNRAAAYAVVLVLGVALGSSHPRARALRDRLARGRGGGRAVGAGREGGAMDPPRADRPRPHRRLLAPAGAARLLESARARPGDGRAGGAARGSRARVEAARAARRAPLLLALVPGPGRAMAAPLAGAAIAWAAHGLVDWDWDMPGVTLPAMAFLGVLVGRYSPPVRPMGGLRSRPLRALGFMAATLGLVCLALSAAFPAISDTLAGDALVGVPDRPTPADLRRAADAAGDASSLNPLSVEGPLAQAAIDLRRGNLVAARNRILEAARREPDNVHAWRRLAGVELARRDARAAKRAIDAPWRSTRSTSGCWRSRAGSSTA
jgi:hypothetical protein